jgi:hypothetical protein
MGDIAEDADATPIRSGRYLLALPRRLYLAALVVVELWFGYSNWRSEITPGFFRWAVVVVTAAVLVVAVAAWFVPVTVVDERGIHRLTGRYRHILWADVAGFHVVRIWHFARVEAQIPNGRNVILAGVPASALRVPHIGPTSLDLFRPKPLTPSRNSDPTDDPWRPLSK